LFNAVFAVTASRQAAQAASCVRGSSAGVAAVCGVDGLGVVGLGVVASLAVGVHPGERRNSERGQEDEHGHGSWGG
jgi:hypothetical protein